MARCSRALPFGHQWQTVGHGQAGLLLAILTRLRAGPHGKSDLLYKLVFEAPNKAFRPNRTRSIGCRATRAKSTSRKILQ